METNWTAWARSLRFFRLCHSRGGLADDNGDSVIAAFAVTSEQDLLQTLHRLGVTLERVSANDPIPQPGVAYTGAEWAQFVTPIKAYPTYKQPGHILLAGHKAFLWVSADRLEISVLDAEQPYDITAASVQAAQAIETLLPPLVPRLIDPPRDAELCL